MSKLEHGNSRAESDAYKRGQADAMKKKHTPFMETDATRGHYSNGFYDQIKKMREEKRKKSER